MRTRCLAALASLVIACGGAPPVAPHAAAAPPPEASWRRVLVSPTTLSMEMPGEVERQTISVPWLDTHALSVVATTQWDGLLFEASAHDLVGTESAEASVALALIQNVLTHAGATMRDTHELMLQGAPGFDGVAEMANGRVLLMRTVLGRTRVYHPIVMGERAAIDRHRADIDRYFASMSFDPDDTPWHPGTGVLADGATWSWVHPIGSGLSVEMPGEPSLAPATSSWPNAEAFDVQSASADQRRIYRVRLSHFNGRPPRDLIASLVDHSRSPQATLTEPATVLLEGTGGRTWTVTTASTRTTIRVFVTSATVYELSVTLPLDANPADAARFFDSFHMDLRCFIQR